MTTDRDVLTAKVCRECEYGRNTLNGRYCTLRDWSVEYPSQRAFECPEGKFPAGKRTEARQLELF